MRQPTAILAFLAATSVLLLACNDGDLTLPEEQTSVWIAKDTGLLQCAPSRVFTLEEHLAELDAAGVSPLDAATGGIWEATCAACVCSANRYNFALVREADVAAAVAAGFRVPSPEDIFLDDPAPSP